MAAAVPIETTIKSLSESGLTSIPSCFASKNFQDLEVIDPQDGTIPIIDFSLLTSSNPQQKCKIIQDLGKACEEWGFFLLINHGIPERLMKSIMDGVKGFFDMSDEEKREFQGNHVLDHITCSSFNAALKKVQCWRDFLKCFVYPEFHFPHKPAGFSDTAFEYIKKTREVTMELLKGVSESLGLEPNYLSKALNLDSGLERFVANLYPPCPQPELTMGIHPHTDPGLLNILLENGISGLQILLSGKWFRVYAPPIALMVNIADQLEIVINGKYKSTVHRATLYSKAMTTRMSLAMAYGPSPDGVIRPAPELVNESHPPAYTAITYREYYELHQAKSFAQKTALDCIRIQN